MKKIFIAVMISLGIYTSYGQTLTYEDFKSLIPHLQKEDWKSAFKASAKLLDNSENDSSEFHAIIVYINIFSAAGMVTEKQMTYKELEENIMKFQGQKIVMSAHPVSTRDGALGQIKFDVSDSTNAAFTSATNAKGTNILCFEKFQFKDKIDLEDYPEKSFVRCGGTLSKIEFNPNKSTVWILRLTITDAFVRKAN
jgi:hypothetical protein